jgi:Flp pilus assembly protein TadD
VSRLSLWLLASTLLAHGPLHEQIDVVTQEIAGKPGDAGLYLKRAELQRHHGEWKLSAADYDRASQLDPSLSAVDLGRAKLALDFGEPAKALTPARRFLKKNPQDFEGRLALAESLQRTGRFRDAASEYALARRCPGGDQAEVYLSEARSWHSAGQAIRALAAIDFGIGRFGPLVVLQAPAIEWERQRKNWDSALRRLDTLAAQSERKETWLAQRGDILAEAGRSTAATVAYRQALKAIELLSPGLRSTKAAADLERHVHSRLLSLH